MSNWLNVGVWRHLLRIPPAIGKRRVAGLAGRARTEAGGLSEEHRAVHHFVVQELPRVGRPLSPDAVADRLDLPPERVVGIVDELEAKKGFLFREGGDAVVWAYPVTAAETPHRLSFKSGERLYAA
ncbi:MAG: hypothetical protein OEP52_03330 [Acidimicrobiia bacterium]|nr:hypothetical protein [Acidimicrobiia bacterium]